MPKESIPGFIRLKHIAKRYNTSRRSVERRRDKAREAGESATYAQFKLRTRGGTVYDEPTLDKVKELQAGGLMPEWFVAKVWLRREFGERQAEPKEPSAGGAETSSENKPPSDQPQELHAELRLAYETRIAEMQRSSEARVDDLKEQLAAAERREKEVAAIAEKDKLRFATAASDLTQVALKLPAAIKLLEKIYQGLDEGSKIRRIPANSGEDDAPSEGDGQSSSKSRGRWLPRLFRRA